MKKKTVGIIGFGRFGKVLYRLLKNDFPIAIYTRSQKSYENFNFEKNTLLCSTPEKLYQKAEVIFYCVPIREFENVIKNHRQFLKKHLLLDVLSVKTHPLKVFKKYLKNTEARAILTHPMFGPDSAKESFENLPLVIYNLNAKQEEYSFWKKFFSSKGIKIVELSPQEHDKMAAYSQGVTHFIGRMLQKFDFKPTPIDTLGAKKLQEVMEQTCNDTWELFYDLQNFNPYTKSMRIKLGKAYEKLYNQILPKRINPKSIVYGIQGGKGSFNEQAILFYTKARGIRNFKIKYLYTTSNVLSALQKGEIDFGLFAVHNSVGGIVWESARALASYKVKIIEEFPIRIRHFLMTLPDVPFEKIDTIIAHPQVLKQCKKTLKKLFPSLKQISGKGKLIDTAAAAKALVKGKLPKNYAILGPKQLSKIYNLKIIKEDLQDDKNNLTYFFLVTLQR